ncbi:hypothetical protein AB4072_09795 [Microvirga sp. 2MCAF38]|uniref:hypothetical protein n=1 Tax=Microvirga sp. 2MCAF38 TaxID=3232989 RepID=UPI003F956B2A
MALAVAKNYRMAGFHPATRIRSFATICALGLFSCSSILTPVQAQVDVRAESRMHDLRKALFLAERNLKLSIEQRDFSRAELVNSLLFLVQSQEPPDRSGACSEALDGLSLAAGAAAFALHPVTDEISDRFSKTMRPSDEALKQWFADGSSKYRASMISCEELIGTSITSRALPDRILP